MQNISVNPPHVERFEHKWVKMLAVVNSSESGFKHKTDNMATGHKY